MDLYKFPNPPSFDGAEMVNGYSSITWVERYRDPGEVVITAPISSGVREMLPMGSVVSQVKTLEPMIIESHEIKEDIDEEPVVTITGRSFETFLQNRIVGQNQNWAVPAASIADAGYVLPAGNLHTQILKMINDHISSGVTINAADVLPNVTAISAVTGTIASDERVIKRGDLHERTVELLAMGDYGIKVRRANQFPGTADGVFTRYIVHNGVDKTKTVTFSAQTGDISTADYLWTMKKWKNAALVTGKFVETIVNGTETGYERRVMFVDANDMDGALTSPPVGGALVAMRNAMAVRGRQALASQKEITLANVNIAETRSYRYREDYEVGDLVRLDGNFGQTLTMRVVAYAEIEDNEGETGYPTLSVVDV